MASNLHAREGNGLELWNVESAKWCSVFARATPEEGEREYGNVERGECEMMHRFRSLRLGVSYRRFNCMIVRMN